MFGDIVVIATLLWATFTGMRTLARHEQRFQKFGLLEIFQLRIDALFYFLTVSSTSLCLIDSILRTLWLVEVGWKNSGTKWAILWLGYHFSAAVIATGLHVLTDRLLVENESCPLCRMNENEK